MEVAAASEAALVVAAVGWAAAAVDSATAVVDSAAAVAVVMAAAEGAWVRAADLAVAVGAARAAVAAAEVASARRRLRNSHSWSTHTWGNASAPPLAGTMFRKPSLKGHGRQTPRKFGAEAAAATAAEVAAAAAVDVAGDPSARRCSGTARSGTGRSVCCCNHYRSAGARRVGRRAHGIEPLELPAEEAALAVQATVAATGAAMALAVAGGSRCLDVPGG